MQNKYGKTALHRAAENNAYDMALFLVEKGIDTSIKDANGQTAYDYAVQSNNKDIIALLEKYVK